jgi:hypothetical protein
MQNKKLEEAFNRGFFKRANELGLGKFAMLVGAGAPAAPTLPAPAPAPAPAAPTPSLTGTGRPGPAMPNAKPSAMPSGSGGMTRNNMTAASMGRRR